MAKKVIFWFTAAVVAVAVIGAVKGPARADGAEACVTRVAATYAAEGMSPTQEEYQVFYHECRNTAGYAARMEHLSQVRRGVIAP